ncbi:trypsin-like serine protease [Cytophagaceae bacterium YF14B1]|uniref:Trypsin-like serine protease n=1 Tax=Xanthocytophaga flava TaxID=3048013 RepID=A0AAE3QRY1_9BACT|nr:AVAST type 2 anti-phage system protein Avs2 [Xanthocytophaga flavus]MDJ1484230.1 trypsin-like serine protease [Xanthocytophaga flavus]
MLPENDNLLSRLTVRLQNTSSLQTVGSGTIYYSEHLKDKVYILTAAHCLYQDSSSFQAPFTHINIDIYNPETNSYSSITSTIDPNLVSPQEDNDLAVLVLDKTQIEATTGHIPIVLVTKEKQTVTTFVAKGFPNATLGKELACIYPAWVQVMTGVNKFQLGLEEDYTSWSTLGFSGSGVFLHTNNQLYLHGIFTRFRPEGKGKVIYCQYVEAINQLLENSYLPLISFTFLGENGLTPDFFKTHIKTAIKNLGPRFNEELNFRLPVAQRFHDMARDNVFKQKLIKCIDNYLLARNYLHSKEYTLLDGIETDYQSFREELEKWIHTINWSPDQKINSELLTSKLNSLNERVSIKRNQLHSLQWEEERKNLGKQKDPNYKAPFEGELSRLREISQTNNDFLDSLHKIDIHLANSPYFLIQGDAGCGKSHLLGDIAQERMKRQKPTLLILGQSIRRERGLWQNILNQLDLSCSKDALLSSLNNIGKQIGSRVLILVDALNEGDGKKVWPTELAGFISEITPYPFIGLVLTVRSTYYDVVVPKAVQEDSNITRFTHQGFKGNEYAALNLFCEHYGLQQPNFPILSPEFTHPLFLQLICESVKASRRKTFPQGFQGIKSIYEYYMKHINQKLSNRRDEYRLRTQLAQQAIYAVAQACFRKDNRILYLEEANELFDNQFARFPNLLADLIEDNVLIKNLYHEYKTDEQKEAIYFAYERFGDFLMAEQLLQDCSNAKEVKKSFKKGNALGKLAEDSYWYNEGILEAMAVLLPEKFNIEIVEVFNWIFKEEPSNQSNIDDHLNHYLLRSLKWRTINSINEQKLVKWFRGNQFSLDDNTYIFHLLEMASLPSHPFNGDRLHRILKQFPMPKRDGFWQQMIRLFSGTDDDGNAYPITRLMDWAWQSNISTALETEMARLTGQTLAWVLSSTDRALRDKVTKAMVNLLEEQSDALTAILQAFNDIDDMYILERLYAVAYGCALRTSTDSSLQAIAQFTFDTIFKPGNPPNHILLRDYARNIIEYALYKQLPIHIDEELIRPPYRSKMPGKIPTKDNIKKYEIDHESPSYRENNGSANNDILHSVMDWDFGNYIIDPALSDFSPISYTMSLEYKNFVKNLNKNQREAIKGVEAYYEMLPLLRKMKEQNNSKIISQAQIDELIESGKTHLEQFESLLDGLLDTEQRRFFKEKIIPHFESVLRTKNDSINFFDTFPIRRWIVQRVFELGYDSTLHGSYDSRVSSYSRHSENKVERIGKKYQWIAFYEIMAMVTDNYKLREVGGWKHKTTYKSYQGPWEPYLRNIDPVFTTKNSSLKIVEDDDLGVGEVITTWWGEEPYTYWYTPDAEWMKATKDLPNPVKVIQKTDEAGQEWLYLHLNKSWNEPKPIGKEKYRTRRKDLWYFIQGYLVKKKDKDKTIERLRRQNFSGRWIPEHATFIHLCNRENYWSPASKDMHKAYQIKVWEPLRDSNLKVMIATSEAVGEMSEDRSEAHLRYDMPCRTLFEGMNLQYASKDGDLKNTKGEIVVTSINPQGVLIRKGDFLEFLKKNNLDVIWTLLGEKRSINNSDKLRNNLFSTICGVYYYEEDKIKGSSVIYEDR